MINEDEQPIRTQIKNEVKNILNIGQSQYKKIDSYKNGNGWVVTYYNYSPINLTLLKNVLITSHLSDMWDIDVVFIDGFVPKTSIKLTKLIDQTIESNEFTDLESMKLFLISNIFKFHLDNNVPMESICSKLNLSKHEFIELLDLSNLNVTLDLVSKVAKLNNKSFRLYFA